METLQAQLEFAKAVSDETRYQIMMHLCCVWLNVGEIVEKLNNRVNQPTVSHHLHVLESAGLVHVRREGRQRFYRLNEERITVCCNQLVRTLAPTYASSIIPIDEITTAEQS